MTDFESIARHQRLLSRREALARLGAGTLLALGLWPGSLHAKNRTGASAPFRFVVVNDTHYMTPECGLWLEKAVRLMKAESPEFCLLCGDLTEQGQKEHLGATREIFRGLGVPTHAVLGNHDYLTQTDRRPYEKLFRKQVNYWFEHQGWQFVGLDSTEGKLWENTSIQPDTLRWLDKNVRKLDRAKPTVIFTHFPLGGDVSMRPANTDALLERFREVNLKGVFSGHWHGYTLRYLGDVFAVTGSCCSLKRGNHDRTRPKGFLVCEAREGAVTHRFVECPSPRGQSA